MTNDDECKRERVAQLDCVLSVLQVLSKEAPNEVALYLNGKVSVDASDDGGIPPQRPWTIRAWHKYDHEGLVVHGVGATVREAIVDTMKVVRALILAGGSQSKARWT